MEKIIERKIKYESKKYGLYYVDNILTLILDEDLEAIWKNMFKSLKERTVDDNLFLEEITSSGHRITFINIKLIRQSGGIYKAFVPAYIIGNSNMTNPPPKIDNFETMIFYGKCIDNFFDPQKVIELGNEDVNEINVKLKALKNDEILIEKDKFNVGVGSTLSWTEKNTNTPVVLKSYLQINFENKKSIAKVIEYYRKISELFEFLYLREHIKFNEIKLISRGKVKIENEIIEYDSEEELNEKISNTFKNTRNRRAHGNMKNEILFSDMDVVAYVIVERLVQCLVFYKANVDMNKIKEIVDDRF